MKNKFYVYVHYRQSDKIPFYVGKGSEKRAWNFSNRNNYWKNVKAKHGVVVEVIFDNLTEDESFQVEKDIILEFKYFGYKLTNLSSGGEGPTGLKKSIETRQRMSNSFKGRTHSSETKIKIGKSRIYPRGLNNSNADRNTYEFVREKDGLVFTGTRLDLCQKFNLKSELLNALFKSRKRNQACGWKLNKRIEYDKKNC